jgi:hypothetical protein
MFQNKYVEKIKTHFYVQYFFLLSLAVYEIKCKGILGPDCSQMTILRMRTTSWIPKATNTQSEHVILILYMDHTVGVTFMCGDISSHTQHTTYCANHAVNHG